MSNLARMKAATAAHHPPIAQPSVTVSVKKPKADKPESPKVTYRCGHMEPVKCFLAGDCPACRNKTRKARIEKVMAKQESKGVQTLGRLPDGACFSASYNAVAQEWTGCLTIGDSVFMATASGLQRSLLSKLDAEYRRSLETK